MLKSGFHANNPLLVRRSAPIGLAQQRITLVTWMNKSTSGKPGPCNRGKRFTFGSLGAGQRFLALHRRSLPAKPSPPRFNLSLISFIQEIIVGRYFGGRRCERSITSTSLPTDSCNQCHSVMTTNTRTSKLLRQNPEGPVAKVRYLLLLNIYSGS
jgi:hypothetical protein